MTKNLKIVLTQIDNSIVTRNEFISSITFLIQETYQKYLLGFMSEKLNKYNFWKCEVEKNLISLMYLLDEEETKTSFKNRRKAFEEVIHDYKFRTRIQYLNSRDILQESYPKLIWKIHYLEIDDKKELENMLKDCNKKIKNGGK